MTNQQNATGATAANINHIPFETDAGVAHRAAIGLIVLSTDRNDRTRISLHIQTARRRLLRKPYSKF